ncbi:MAG TPA: transposase, partial [Nitrospirota bacterium]|nr:transposase [Nitrospirota bacterium]
PGYRSKIFVKGVKEYSGKTRAHVSGRDPDIEVIKLSVQVDHVQIVIVIPPGIAVADVVQLIRSQSAKRLKAKFPFLHNTYAGKEGILSRGYCVSCRV